MDDSTKELKYRDAAEEIERTLREIEDEREADVDELADKVERAAELIRFCFDRLKKAETRVRKATEELAAATAAGAPDSEDSEDSDAEASDGVDESAG